MDGADWGAPVDRRQVRCRRPVVAARDNSDGGGCSATPHHDVPVGASLTILIAIVLGERLPLATKWVRLQVRHPPTDAHRARIGYAKRRAISYAMIIGMVMLTGGLSTITISNADTF